MMKKVIICGSRFGQFYIEALKNMHDVEIVGLLANGSERSIKCADHYNLNLFTNSEFLPDDIDAACVAIGSSVFGGSGVDVAKNLLKRGISVLFEQPIHIKEISELYNTAISNNAKFQIGNLYNNLLAVKNFILNAEIANKINQPSYLMIDLNTQLSYPVSGIIRQILKDTIEIKENYKYIEEESCCNILSMSINKTEVCIRAFNEMGKENSDSNMRMLFSMVLGYPSGRLILSSPLGPVLWEQSPNMPKIDLVPSLLDNEDKEGINKPWMSILYDAAEYDKSYVYRNIWVEAIKEDLKKFVFEERRKEQLYETRIQNELEISVLWQKIMGNLGYPKIQSMYATQYIDPYDFKPEAKVRYTVKESINELDKVCRDTMFYYLTKHISDSCIPVSLLLDTLTFNYKYKKIMERWINHLISFNYLKRKEDNIFIKIEKIDRNDLIQKWDVLESRWNKEAMPMSVFRYFKNNAKSLDDLLNKKVNANEVLFEKSNDEVAKELYSKTAISVYLNEVMTNKIKELCNIESLTILELGGGTGATTEKIIADIKFDKYIFTDISRYFIEKAKNNFFKYKNIEYGNIDIDNEGSYKQVKSKVDLIIAVGVLNNAKNIEKTITYMRGLLKDDGFLMIVEAVDESPEILISQVFMMSETDDIRSEQNITFLKMEQWLEIFKNQYLELLTYEPNEENFLENFNQKLFILKNKGSDNCGNRK